MLVGIRDGEASPFEAAGIDELALQPLSDRDAREMVSRLAPGLAPSVRDRILQEAAGNPLALAELSATIRDDVASGEGLPDILPLSARLEREFAARADDLPARHAVAPADRRARRSRRGLRRSWLPPACRHRPSRRRSTRGSSRSTARRFASAIRSSGRRSSSGRPSRNGSGPRRTGGGRRRLRPGGLASCGRDRRARRVGRRAPRRRRRTGDPARRTRPSRLRRSSGRRR